VRYKFEIENQNRIAGISSKKILFYSYIHKYAKINENDEPIKIEELRTVIKDIE
jgi:hypothetical protein